jgi:RNA polymerase sigma-70 factor (ECF subfamily)
MDRYSSIEALAITTIKNHCIDILRRNKKYQYDDNDRRVHVMTSEPGPHETLEFEETAQLMNILIGKLPDNFRKIIVMKEIDGLSYEEIAAITNQNINTLRVNLSRARSLIRDELRKRKYEYSGSKSSA